MRAEYRGTDTYTKQNHHGIVKENFKQLAEIIRAKIENKTIPHHARVLDVGCATGSLLGYLSTVFPEFSFSGTDVSEELIGIAKEKVPQAGFSVNNLFSLSATETARFDLVLLIGVLGIFDEVQAEEVFDHLIAITRPGGVIYVFSQFNEFDVDVILRYRRTSPDAKWDGWGSGWNIFSCRTIRDWLSHKSRSIRFIPFKMPLPLLPQENPIRSWTIPIGEETFQLVNGLKLLVDLSFLEIQL